MKTKEQYRELLEARLNNNRFKMAAAGAALGAVLGAGAGVAAPHVSDAKVGVMKTVGDPAGISNVETARQGLRDKIGLGANTPATTRAGVGAGIFAPLGAAIFARGPRKKSLSEIYRLTPKRRDLLNKIEAKAKADYMDYIDRTTDHSSPDGLGVTDVPAELERQQQSAEGRMDRVNLIRQLSLPRDRRKPTEDQKSIFISKPVKAQDRKLKGALKSARILQHHGWGGKKGQRPIGY